MTIRTNANANRWTSANDGLASWLQSYLVRVVNDREAAASDPAQLYGANVWCKTMIGLNHQVIDTRMPKWTNDCIDLLAELDNPDAYPNRVDSVRHFQTHISDVFLAGDFAYKLKKPIKTDFLDYSTLEKRHHFCLEELRLDGRYADDLYIDVVPITITGNRIRVEGPGDPIEYAVKMHRFSDHDLLSNRVDEGLLSRAEIDELAGAIATFHETAERQNPAEAMKVPEKLSMDMKRICETLTGELSGQSASTLNTIRSWSDNYLPEHADSFRRRSEEGMIRECHGDLHLQNIVKWRGRLIPFDGIEFNDDFRWIDIISDAAFLAMDLAACEHLDLSRCFVNSYLERTGDYGGLLVMRWYLVYRSLIRAMVAEMKADQNVDDSDTAMQDCRNHVDLAYRYTLTEQPLLMITHGLSGSGKTTVSDKVVQRRGAIRLRSDIERKRLFGIDPNESITDHQRQMLYNPAANSRTYTRLESLAANIMSAGFPVIVDGTFLKRADRDRFRSLANERGANFLIFDCQADTQTLRQRISDRMAADHDASDADLCVLDLQLATQEPLSPDERQFCFEVPNLGAAIDRL